MRVLHVSSTYPRADGDSVGPFVADLVAAQAAAGADVAVLAPSGPGLDAYAVVAGAPVRRFRYAPRRFERLAYRGGLLGAVRNPVAALFLPAYLVAFVVAATREARRWRADVVQAHWWLPGGLAGLVAARIRGVPLVITCHGSDVHLARRRAFRWLARLVVRRAAAVVAVSDALAVEMSTVLGLRPEQIHVVPMPVAPGTPTGLPPGPPWRVVVAGRLAEEKGHSVLLRAMRRARDAGVPVEAVIVGDGPLGPQLVREATDLGLAESVTFRAAVPRAELPSHLAAAHALVVPSRREGMGLIALEALAIGRPVIASAVGGLPEAVADGDDGVLVGPGDEAELAAALGTLPLPPPTGVALRRHRPEACARAYAELYAAVVAERAPRWRPLRWVGTGLGVAVVAALIGRLGDDWPAVRASLRGAHAGAVAVAVVLATAAEAAYALAAAVALRRLTPVDRPLVRIAAGVAVSQMARVLPGGIWTGVARVALAQRWGVAGREVVGWLGLEMAASCVEGAVLGAALLAAAAAAGVDVVLPAAAWAVLAASGALSVFILDAPVARRLAARAAGARISVPTARAVGATAPAFSGAGLLAAGAAAALAWALVPGVAIEVLVAVGGAAIVAALVGFLAVPVPAGLGVREAVFTALVAPALGFPLAAAVALASRILSTLCGAGLAICALPVNAAENHQDISDTAGVGAG